MPKICPYPFSRIEYNPHYYIPCCFDWLTDEYRNLDHSHEDKWNSEAAIELRRRILKGDYSLCRRDYCQIKLKDPQRGAVKTADCDINEERMSHIKQGRVTFSGPTSVAITSDRRCNLACESCRPKKITKLTKEDKYHLDQTKMLLSKHANSIKIIKMVGDGEVFYSPYLSKFLKQLSPQQYPSLDRVYLLTNGTLLSEENYERHKPGIKYVKKISVSIDAGTEEVYKQVRGDHWPRLMENLSFISRLRKQETIIHLSISFVVRKKNFHTMMEFAKLGYDIGADQILFSAFHPWHSIRDHLDYDAEAIHYPTHPDHEILLSEIYKVRHMYPKVEFKFSYRAPDETL